MLADNSHHLIEAAQRRHNDAHQRAHDAIGIAAARSEAVSATTLAARAGVSRAFLYANPELIEAIRQLRGTGQPAGALPARQRASEASLLRRLEALTQRNKELRIENRDLRQRLEVAHGRVRALDQRAGASTTAREYS